MEQLGGDSSSRKWVTTAILVGILISFGIELIADPIRDYLDTINPYAALGVGLAILFYGLYVYRRQRS